jgi:histidine triad (HIT) family protein
MRNDCLFCAIWDREIPSKEIARNDSVMAFYDIKPQAPVHALLIPKKHVRSVAELEAGDALMSGEMLLFAKEIAEELGVDQEGYRIIFNTRHHGGQEVDHIHLHLLAGKPFGRLVS